MKPDWDSLAPTYEDSKKVLIADVDCTAAGKPLCDKYGVRGYPTIKYFNPPDEEGEDYKGGRDFAALEKFAKGLKPVCSPAKMDLCEPEMKEKILELQKLSAADLDKQIKEKEAEIEKAEKFFTDEVDKLQKQYQKLQEDKESTITAVKDSGLGLMKSVKAAAGKAEL